MQYSFFLYKITFLEKFRVEKVQRRNIELLWARRLKVTQKVIFLMLVFFFLQESLHQGGTHLIDLVIVLHWVPFLMNLCLKLAALEFQAQGTVQ